MSETAKLQLPDGSTVDLPVVIGTEGEPSVDISKLRAQTGYVTLDDGYGNTGSCLSNITFIDGDKGILRYRGYPIEALAEKSSFIEAAQLLIWGELPTETERRRFDASWPKSSHCAAKPSSSITRRPKISASCWVTTPRSLRR